MGDFMSYKEGEDFLLKLYRDFLEDGNVTDSSYLQRSESCSNRKLCSVPESLPERY